MRALFILAILFDSKTELVAGIGGLIFYCIMAFIRVASEKTACCRDADEYKYCGLKSLVGHMTERNTPVTDITNVATTNSLPMCHCSTAPPLLTISHLQSQQIFPV